MRTKGIFPKPGAWQGREREMVEQDSEKQMIIDVIAYIVAMTESAYRFSKGLPPFDFNSQNMAVFMLSCNLPFIEDKDVPYKKAHELFLVSMLEDGWKFGPEDFDNKTHPDLVPFDQLPDEARERIAFRAAIVSSAREFYATFKQDVEDAMLNDGRDRFMGSRISMTVH
jgi:hypothetical protein